jgi:NADH dehydrogenase
VILGGGFGGLYAARTLANKDVDVTLVDRRNFHLFQPLLYQVATGTLSPGDIAFPLRSALRKARNVRVLLGEALDLDAEAQCVCLADGTRLPYDYLVVALGSTHTYFGHPEWEQYAPPLKSLENALEMRRTIFCAFERAELEPDPKKRKELLTFTIIGGGSTGVELAGTLAEIARETLREDFRSFDPRTTRIILVEMAERILPSYPAKLSEAARRSLESLGVEVLTRTSVTAIEDDCVVVEGCDSPIPSSTTLWAAGVGSSPFALVLQRALGCELERGRVAVDADLTVPGHPNVFVLGDLSAHPDKLAGVAQVAIQGGQHAARSIVRGSLSSFRYRDKGNLSVIGRNRAVADIGRFEFAGFFAWLVWAVVHIAYLIGFESKVLVMFQWAWNYLFFNRSARLITESPEA